MPHLTRRNCCIESEIEFKLKIKENFKISTLMSVEASISDDKGVVNWIEIQHSSPGACIKEKRIVNSQLNEFYSKIYILLPETATGIVTFVIARRNVPRSRSSNKHDIF